MSISKIGSLFAANVDAVPATSPASPVTAQASTPQAAAAAPNDAVVLARNLQTLNRTPLSETDSARTSKVQDLKQRVKSGSYKPDSEKVAVAVIRDLA
jgi:flagellar biosynthesis anti-sigma factor FlgM